MGVAAMAQSQHKPLTFKTFEDFLDCTTVELLRSQAGQRPRAFQWHNLATAWCMRRQKDQAKIGSRAMPATSSKRLMRWRISHTLRATKGRDGVSSPLTPNFLLAMTINQRNSWRFCDTPPRTVAM